MKKREITEVLWITGNENSADAMTNRNLCDTLERLMNGNKLVINPTAWIDLKMSPPPKD